MLFSGDRRESKEVERNFPDGLVAMISACQTAKRGRPGFDSLSRRIFLPFFFLVFLRYHFFFLLLISLKQKENEREKNEANG